MQVDSEASTRLGHSGASRHRKWLQEIKVDVVFWHVLPQAVAVELTNPFLRCCAFDPSNIAQLGQRLLQVVFNVDKSNAMIKRRSSQRIGKDEHRAATISPITIRSQSYFFCPWTYD